MRSFVHSLYALILAAVGIAALTPPDALTGGVCALVVGISLVLLELERLDAQRWLRKVLSAYLATRQELHECQQADVPSWMRGDPK